MKSRQAFRTGVVAGAVCFFLSGFIFGAWYFNNMIAFFVAVVLGLSAVLATRYADKEFNKFEKERLDYEKGAKGEALAAKLLDGLPGNYHVFHDFSVKYFGNVDHAVIGPTGIFIIETKNWKGIVSAKDGELLINGEPTERSEVHNFLRRVMTLKDNLRCLCKDKEIYLQALIVFTPAASLNINKYEIKNIECINDGDLCRHIIVERKNRLSEAQIKDYADAFEELAKKDRGFEAAAGTVSAEAG